VSRARAVALAALAALGASGCVLTHAGTGRALPTGQSPVAPGTTKASLLEELGPPMAIAAAGEVVEVAAEPVGWFPRGSAPSDRAVFLQQGDAWLALFAARRPLEARHRVYYWYATSTREHNWWPILFLYHAEIARLDELWVLVDEETERVVDAFHRRR
jgi:hypothetical protein